MVLDGSAASRPTMREYDPYAYEMHEDPYPTYAELRAQAPVYRNERLGVPQADRDELRAWADIVVHREEGMTDVPPAGMEAAMHMLGYFGGLVADHRAHPRDDLTSALLAAEIDGDRLDDVEVLGFL